MKVYLFHILLTLLFLGSTGRATSTCQSLVTSKATRNIDQLLSQARATQPSIIEFPERAQFVWRESKGTYFPKVLLNGNVVLAEDLLPLIVKPFYGWSKDPFAEMTNCYLSTIMITMPDYITPDFKKKWENQEILMRAMGKLAFNFFETNFRRLKSDEKPRKGDVIVLIQKDEYTQTHGPFWSSIHTAVIYNDSTVWSKRVFGDAPLLLRPLEEVLQEQSPNGTWESSRDYDVDIYYFRKP